MEEAVRLLLPEKDRLAAFICSFELCSRCCPTGMQSGQRKEGQSGCAQRRLSLTLCTKRGTKSLCVQA